MQICSDLLVCSVSRRKQKIMTDQMSDCSARRQSAWAEGSHLHQTGWRQQQPKCARTHYVLKLQLPAQFVVVDSALVGLLVVDVLDVVVVVVGVCDGCEQSAVHWATAVLGRVGRPRGRYYTQSTTCANPFANNQDKGLLTLLLIGNCEDL